MMASPAEMGSPSALSQDTTFPSFIVEERAGISIWLNSKSGAAVAITNKHFFANGVAVVSK
eukprot:6888801-Ditylum_brightwellii.AAC.1